ncbi:DUF1992 domain-containing protein [Bacillus tianshenii]|nr:DUF1992 domain-containing protein [Bacillus tianshenii]
MDFFSQLAEERIKQSVNQGDFEHLPGKGKPLELEDLSSVPEELRVGYKILKNAGVVPEEIQLKKEILRIEDLISCCYDENERSSLQRRLSEKTLRFNQLMEKRKFSSNPSFSHYQHKIYSKFR